MQAMITPPKKHDIISWTMGWETLYIRVITWRCWFWLGPAKNWPYIRKDLTSVDLTSWLHCIWKIPWKSWTFDVKYFYCMKHLPLWIQFSQEILPKPKIGLIPLWRRFPGISYPSDWGAVSDPSGGILLADKCRSAVQNSFVSLGGQIEQGEH